MTRAPLSSVATFETMTPRRPGGVALIHVAGPGAVEVCAALTGANVPEEGGVCRADFAGIDDGLIATLPGGVVQLNPHGGPQIVLAVEQALTRLGARPAALASSERFPEAAGPIEQDLCAALVAAASPAAIDVLSGQPDAWRNALRDGSTAPGALRESVFANRNLDRLLTPAIVALVGVPNAGKSTLLNRLAGRKAAIVDPAPGATRDRLELDIDHQGVVVRWIDTPGLRRDAGRVEQAALAATRPVVAQADVVVVLGDRDRWPDFTPSPDAIVLWVRNKTDLDPGFLTPQETDADSRLGGSIDTPLALSAKTGQGIDQLVEQVRRALGLTQTHLAVQAPWAFSPALKRWSRGEALDLVRYLGVNAR
ncbi:MAG: GTPase [Planctomycetota bacterium]